MADGALNWRQCNPTATYPDHRWRARVSHRCEFRILFQPDRTDGHCFHLHRVDLDEDGRPGGRRLALGVRTWFPDVADAQAAAERWLEACLTG